MQTLSLLRIIGNTLKFLHFNPANIQLTSINKYVDYLHCDTANGSGYRIMDAKHDVPHVVIN